jgi:hypothetical protein
MSSSFLQFADQAVFRRLAWFELTAGEFPQASQGLPLWPLADQHPAIDVHQGGGGHQKHALVAHAFAFASSRGQRNPNTVKT